MRGQVLIRGGVGCREKEIKCSIIFIHGLFLSDYVDDRIQPSSRKVRETRIDGESLVTFQLESLAPRPTKGLIT